MAVRIDLLPLADYPTGSRIFGPLAIADDIIGIVLEFQRCTSADLTIWPSPLTELWVRMELSLDDGATWICAGGIGAPGGILPGLNVAELTDNWLKVDLLPGIGRLLRGEATVTNGPLRSCVSVVIDSVTARDIVRPPR